MGISHLVNFIQEGDWYHREYVWSTGAHRGDRRGVHGNTLEGCDSIVASRLDKNQHLGGHDNIDNLSYTCSNPHEGGKSLFTSYNQQNDIRVFHSSKLYKNNDYKHGKVKRLKIPYYRYDGLYRVCECQNSHGEQITIFPEKIMSLSHLY